MKRINLLLAPDLRELTLAFSAASASDGSTTAVAKLIERGAGIVDGLAADKKRDLTALRGSLVANYDLIKLGKGPKIAVYLDRIDGGVLHRAILALGIHPKSRALRMFLALGLAEAIEAYPHKIHATETLSAFLAQLERARTAITA